MGTSGNPSVRRTSLSETATAQRPVARLSAGTAAGLGVTTGAAVTVRGAAGGQITLPLVVTPMPDDVVWLPTNAPGSAVRATLGADAGDLVRVSAAAITVPDDVPTDDVPTDDVPTHDVPTGATSEEEGL